MKIALAGSFSTGKTTLVDKCAEKLRNDYKRDVYVIEEVARRIILEGYPLDRRATIESNHMYIYYQLESERQAQTHQDVISDRSLLDSLAYIRTNRDPGIPNSFESMLTEIVWKETLYYDAYCYVPIEFSPVDDGLRSIDKEYQQLVDNEVVNLLKHFGVRTIRVKGSIENRVKSLIDIFAL